MKCAPGIGPPGGRRYGTATVPAWRELTGVTLPVRLRAVPDRSREAKRLRVYPLACEAVNLEKNRPAPLGRTAWRFERRRSGTCRDGGMSDFSDERRHAH